MRKIALLLLVIFTIFACSDENDKTYSIKLRNNCHREITDVKISMYSLDETNPKHKESLSTGIETENYDFHFDKTSANGCGKFTEITISPIFVISYFNGIIQFDLEIEMDNFHSNKIMLILEEDDYQVWEL